MKNRETLSIPEQVQKNLTRAAKQNRRALFSSKKYDLLVFIGRFQPYHLGHKRVVDKALELAENVVIIVGSANKARSVRNPFTFADREGMILAAHNDEKRIKCLPMNDSAYNDTDWVINVQKLVHEHALKLANNGFGINGYSDVKIGLIGCEKDHTSYYLKLFPQWDSESVEFISPLNATSIRHMYFHGNLDKRWEADAIMPDAVFRLLQEFALTAEYVRLAKEAEYIEQYKKIWGPGPFLTADALVQVGGNILLIKRGKEYGHGLYALPGGFLGQHEKFFEGSIRELKEETRLKVPVPVLKGSVVGSDIFDDPHRSERGRIVTRCFHFKLENELELPEVRGGDDAEWAGFVDFSTLEEKDFFEDHYHIVRKMLAI